MTHKTWDEMDFSEKSEVIKARKRFAENGVELTPDQLINEIANLNTLFKDNLGIDLSMAMLITQTDTPPPPPYNGYFDNLQEASDFRDRAEKKHNIQLVIKRVGIKKWVIKVVD